MSDRPDAWMPLYIADYLRDTQHLSPAEHGAYILLLMKAWIEDGLLPLDERRLARITGLSAKEWQESGPVILEFFDPTAEGYRHKRVDRELLKADANLEQKRAAGRASAAKRSAQRGGNENSTGVATAVATGTPTALQREDQREGQRGGNPSPSPLPKKTDLLDEQAAHAEIPPSPRKPDISPHVAAVMTAARMTSMPNDTGLLRDWLALPDMQLERDIIPIVARVTNTELQRSGRAPFKFKLFDAAIREQCEADEAAKARLQTITERIERTDREQRAASK